MDVAHLRRAALGPTLWQDRLTEAAQAIPLISSETEVKLKDQEQKSYIRLMRIPGNRYFIASTKWNIELWDLGVPYAEESKTSPTLVAEARIGEGLWITSLFDLIPHGSDSVRFAVRTCDRLTEEDL